MLDIDYKVNLKIEFKFLIRKVFLFEIIWHKLFKSSEEFKFVTFVEATLDVKKELLWRNHFSLFPLLLVFKALSSYLRRLLLLYLWLAKFFAEESCNLLKASSIKMVKNYFVKSTY